MNRNIRVEGINTNNLKNINVEVVKDGINLILGPSGSGKSSLAYDTIAQIGQHEYLAMFADDVSEPTYKVEKYNNMIPSIPLKQSNHNNNLRSTIGTYFGINRKVGMIYSLFFDKPDDFFTLNKENNVCPVCHGIGLEHKLDSQKIVSYTTSVEDIPFRCWNRNKDFYSQILTKFCESEGIDSKKKFCELSEKEQDLLLNGSSTDKYTIKYKTEGRIASRTTKYYGVLKNHPLLVNHSIGKNFYSEFICSACHGMKFSPEYVEYKIDNLSIGEFYTTCFSDLVPVIEKLKKDIKEPSIRYAIVSIYEFIKQANDLKLGHLSLNRSIPTLSGGELQRLRLTQIFISQLTNLLIVLDEPLAGLSRIEQDEVVKCVLKLSENNTLLIVDHGFSFVDLSQNIICLGEGGGINGGKVIDSKQYLNSQKHNIDFKAPVAEKMVVLKSNNIIRQYNGVNIKFAFQRLNLFTGNSGVGKSTMLKDYFPLLLEDYEYVSQKPLQGNNNSYVITSIGIYQRVLQLYAKKFKKEKNYFSNFSGNAGCCKKCNGTGYIEFGDKYTSPVRFKCQECKGTGFNINLENYKLNSKSILDVWQMTIDEALLFFMENDKKVSEMLKAAHSVMLGHLILGQFTDSLSGGENIRIKLLNTLFSSKEYIGIDEPFKGLDVNEKIVVCQFMEKLREKGKTLLVVDHADDVGAFFTSHSVIENVGEKIVSVEII